MSVRLGVVLVHAGTLILVQAANVTERAGYNCHWTRARDDVDVRVDVLAADLGVPADGAGDREFRAVEQVVSR